MWAYALGAVTRLGGPGAPELAPKAGLVAAETIIVEVAVGIGVQDRVGTEDARLKHAGKRPRSTPVLGMPPASLPEVIGCAGIGSTGIPAWSDQGETACQKTSYAPKRTFGKLPSSILPRPRLLC